MPYALGIDIGGTATTAAVCRRDGEWWGPPLPVAWGAADTLLPSVLHVSQDGSLMIGDPAADGRIIEPGLVARDFGGRACGDNPVFADGEWWHPQILVAVLASRVLDLVQAYEGELPDSLVLSHPASWGEHRLVALRRSLTEVGINALLLPAPVLAAENHVAASGGKAGAAPGRALAVFAMGGSGFETAVVERVRPAVFGVRSCRGGIDPIGGVHLDEALVEHVRAAATQRLGRLDLTDGHDRATLHALWRECRRAKERLTQADVADVAVQARGGLCRVTVTRAEFEELVRPMLDVAVDALIRTVGSGGLPVHHLDGVLLVGGVAQIPLIADLIAERLPVPVIRPADPRHAVAAGAAVVAAQLVGAPHPEGGADWPNQANWPEPEGWTAAPGNEPSILPMPSSHPRGDGNGPPPRPAVTVEPPNLPAARTGWRRQRAGRDASTSNLVAILAVFMVMTGVLLTDDTGATTTVAAKQEFAVQGYAVQGPLSSVGGDR